MSFQDASCFVVNAGHSYFARVTTRSPSDIIHYNGHSGMNAEWNWVHVHRLGTFFEVLHFLSYNIGETDAQMHLVSTKQMNIHNSQGMN